MAQTEIAQTNDGETLRALIRLFPLARRLREDIERITQTEVYDGIGDITLRSFQGLLDRLSQIITDPYISSLASQIPPTATDKEKVWLAFLGTGQFVAYLEAQTGLVPGSDVLRAPRQEPPIHIDALHLPGVTTLSPVSRVVATIAKAIEGEEEEI